jgi:cytochrome oxidase Cu insertion factor (SCO1/SenC/PrrC family)
MNHRWLIALLIAALTGCTSSRHAKECCDSAPAASVSQKNSPTLTTSGDADSLLVTAFLPPQDRPRLALDHRVTTHEGISTNLQALLDRPAAISFAYSRCSNPNKCPRVVSEMGVLKSALEKEGLLGRVRLLVITYDPAYDQPVVLRSFARRNGLPLDPDAVFLRPENDAARLFQGLQTRASFNDDGVSLHGIQLLLVDRNGRLARTYHTVIWNNESVMHDLEQLIRE